jgi:hypothetical protein
MPFAEETLVNYLTPAAQAAVSRELYNARREGKLFGYPRIFNDLLSSQPLCINLFAPLQADPALATAVFRDLSDGRVKEVIRFEFEHSPGRGDARYSADNSAFDAYFEYLNGKGQRGCVGIEVKYHENMAGQAARHRPRYDEVADAMGCFRKESLVALHQQPLQQLWRDHLLAGSLALADGFTEALFAVVAPRGNTACGKAVTAYRECLCDSRTFTAWNIEDVVSAIERHTADRWPLEFRERYLNFARIDDLKA